MKKSFHEAREILRNLDGKTLEDRAKRLTELETITLGAIDKEISERTSDYLDEAIKAYVEGCYRSCIFCCSCAVEQAFKNEIVLSISNLAEREKTQKHLDKDKISFDGIIKEASKNVLCIQFIKDAKLLKDLRNKIAVHPFYVSKGFSVGVDNPEVEGWRRQTLKSDIETFKPFLDEEDRDKLQKALHDPETLESIFEWGFNPPLVDPLHVLALKAHKTMKKILEGRCL